MSQKRVRDAMKFEETGTAKPRKSAEKALIRMNNDITVMPTSEVLKRLYVRHKAGIWQFMTGFSWILFIFVAFR